MKTTQADSSLFLYVGDSYVYPFICKCGVSKLYTIIRDEKIFLYCSSCEQELLFENYLMKMMADMFNYQIMVVKGGMS